MEKLVFADEDGRCRCCRSDACYSQGDRMHTSVHACERCMTRIDRCTHIRVLFMAGIRSVNSRSYSSLVLCTCVARVPTAIRTMSDREARAQQNVDETPTPAVLQSTAQLALQTPCPSSRTACAQVLDSPSKSAGWTSRMQKRMRRLIQSVAAGRKRLFAFDTDAGVDGDSASHQVRERVSLSLNVVESSANRSDLLDTTAVSTIRTNTDVSPVGDRSAGLDIPDQNRDQSLMCVPPWCSIEDARQNASLRQCQFQARGALVQTSMQLGSRGTETTRVSCSPERVPRTMPVADNDPNAPAMERALTSSPVGQCQVSTPVMISRIPRDSEETDAAPGSAHPLRPRNASIADIHSSPEPLQHSVTIRARSPAIFGDIGIRDPRTGHDGGIIQYGDEHVERVPAAAASPAQDLVRLTPASGALGAVESVPYAFHENSLQPARKPSPDQHCRDVATAADRFPLGIANETPETEQTLSLPKPGALSGPSGEIPLNPAPVPTPLLLGAFMRAQVRNDPFAKDATQQGGPSQAPKDVQRSVHSTSFRQRSISPEMQYGAASTLRSKVAGALAQSLWQATLRKPSLVAVFLHPNVTPHALIAHLCFRHVAEHRSRVLILLDDNPATNLNISFVTRYAVELLAYLRAALGDRMAAASALGFSPNAIVNVALVTSQPMLSPSYRRVHFGLIIVLVGGSVEQPYAGNPMDDRIEPALQATWLKQWLAPVPLTSTVLLLPLLPDSGQAIQIPETSSGHPRRQRSAYRQLLSVVDAPSIGQSVNGADVAVTSTCNPNAGVARVEAQLLVTNPENALVQEESLRQRQCALAAAYRITPADAIFTLVCCGERLLRLLLNETAVQVQRDVPATDAVTALPCGCQFLQHTAADYSHMIREVEDIIRRSLRHQTSSRRARKRSGQALRSEAHRLIALHTLRQAVSMACFEGADVALAFLNQAHREYSRFYGDSAASVQIIENATLQFFDRVRDTPAPQPHPLVAIIRTALSDIVRSDTGTESAAKRKILIVTETKASAALLKAWIASSARPVTGQERDTCHRLDARLAGDRQLVIRHVEEFQQNDQLPSETVGSLCTFEPFDKILLIAPSVRMADLCGRARLWSDLGCGSCFQVTLYALLQEELTPLSRCSLTVDYDSEYAEIWSMMKQRQLHAHHDEQQQQQPDCEASVSTWIAPLSCIERSKVRPSEETR